MKMIDTLRLRAHLRHAAATVAALLVLGACGQKGPLVLPGHGKDTAWPVRTVEPPSAAGPASPAANPSLPGTPSTPPAAVRELQTDGDPDASATARSGR